MYRDGKADVNHTQSGAARLGMPTPCPVNSRGIHCMPQIAED